MNCEEVEELSGAYALGALPSGDLRDVEEHVSSCSKHPDLAELSAVARSLALAAPDADPPLALKTRIMDVVYKESSRAPSGSPRPSILDRLRRLNPQHAVSYALAGALAVAVVALVLTNVDDSTTPGGATVALTGTGGVTGTAHLLEDDIVVMEIDGLEPLGADETYQVWAIESDNPASLGLLSAAPDGRAVQALRADLSDAEALAVTVEPAGGSFAPTTEPILQSKGSLRR